MGDRVLGTSTATLDGREFTGLGIDVGNPHLACVADLSATALRDLDLTAPGFDATFFPNGVNVEIVTPLTDGAVDMRVYERGVGETRSCGTGTVAAAAAALQQAGASRARWWCGSPVARCASRSPRVPRFFVVRRCSWPPAAWIRAGGALCWRRELR